MAEKVYEVISFDGATLPHNMKNNTATSYAKLGRVLGMVFLSIFFAVIVLINILPFFDGDNSLMDFGSFYASGLKIRNGENPYDPNSEYIFEIIFPRIGAGGKMANLNPPISVVLFQFLPEFDPQTTLLIWQAISAVLYVAVVVALTKVYEQHINPAKLAWAFMLAGFWHTLVLGQIYILLLAFAVLGWLFIKARRYVWAGIMIGLLISIKPNFVIWAFFLLAAGYYVTFVASILSSLVISLIPLLLYGTQIYRQWLEASALHRETLIMPGNSSILGLTARFQSMELGIVLSVALVVILLVLSKRKMSNESEQPELVSALGILASILASPISWTGYTIFALPVLFSLQKWSALAWLAAVVLSIPFAIVLQLHQTSFANFILFGWLYGWGLLALLGDVIRKIIMTRSIQTS